MSRTAEPTVAVPDPMKRSVRRRPRQGAERLRLGGRDRVTLTLLVALPTLILVTFIWIPVLASVVLSFTDWNGIGGLGAIRFVGLENFELLLQYPPFWPAVRNNLLWLVAMVGVATPLGIILAALLDRRLRFTRIYQTAYYLPVVLSLPIIGIIWELQYSPTSGFINNVLGRTEGTAVIDWLGNPDLNIWAVLVAAVWRHVGFVMVLYLAGLKSIDPMYREAASIDGASGIQTFWLVTIPLMRPINIVVIVVSFIEGLRAFDLVYIINRGINGLELLSVLVTNNIIGPAQRIGFGSAIAVTLLVISIVPILVYLRQSLKQVET